MKPHILFVCGRNKWRSPTAERIYRNDPRIEVRSAGISGKSPHPLSNADVEWADLILVMEQNYEAWIRGKFRGVRLPRIQSLDIPDDYEFMEPELAALIEAGAEFHIARLTKAG